MGSIYCAGWEARFAAAQLAGSRVSRSFVRVVGRRGRVGRQALTLWMRIMVRRGVRDGCADEATAEYDEGCGSVAWGSEFELEECLCLFLGRGFASLRRRQFTMV